MEDQLYDKLLQGLECPICTEYMSPPIRQCATGHSICETCRNKLKKCPLCQGKFTDSRNLGLEGVAIEMHYPCINKSLGCNAKLSYTERETHELRCPLSGFKCAMDKCPWIGKVEDLAAHWASKKTSSKPYHKSNICHTKIKAESYYVNIVDAHNKLFWFKCKLAQSKLYWAVQYIGPAAEAEKYCYEIEIFKPAKKQKKIIISDYCQAIDIDNSNLFTSETCISINIDSVNSFITGDQLLLYYMRVNVVKDEKPTSVPVAGQAGASHTINKPSPHKPKPGMAGNKQRDRSKGPNKDQKKKYYPKPNNQKEKDGFVVL